MSLAYARDKYKELSKNVLNGNININEQNPREELYKELEVLGEYNIKEKIKNISNKDNNYDYDNITLIKDIFREVTGQNKPQMKVTIQKKDHTGQITEKNEINISTDESYEELGEISINILDYYSYNKNENILDFIKAKGENIKLEIEKEKTKYENNELNIKLKYTISFKKKTPEGKYRQTIEIAFKDIESKIYEFNINCSDKNREKYNFDFKSVDELYNIFKNGVEIYYRSKNVNYKSITDIFNDKNFENYLRHIKEYTAFDLYKNLNIRSYKLKDVNLFFTILGYEQNAYEQQPGVQIGVTNSKVAQCVKDTIMLRLWSLYYIEDIDNNLNLKIFSNKNNEIEIKKVSDLIPIKLNKVLSILFKEQMKKLNSCILIKDNNILKSIFTYYIKKEEVGKSFKVLISSQKSSNELNSYNLKIHM